MFYSRKPLKIFAALALGLLPVVAMADGRWLVGGSAGTAQIRESFDGVRWEPSSTSVAIHGGYQFNDYFALQAGYLEIGSIDDDVVVGDTSINIVGDVAGYTVAALARVPFGKRLDAHARLGSYFYDADVRVDGVDSGASESGLFFGAGVGLSLTDRLSLSLDAERFELSVVHANRYSLGFQVYFR